jgi:AcrR family transcriptional regulator
MNEPNERSEATKRKLLTAARDLLVEHGWGALSNRAIADRAGVNLALISYHFGGQRPLLAAMLDAAVADITATYTPPGPQNDLGEFISRAVEVVPQLASDPSMRVLAVAMLEATHDEEIAASVKRNLKALRAQIAEVVVATGGAPEHSSGLVTVLAALLDGILLHFLLDPETDIAGSAAALQVVSWTE